MSLDVSLYIDKPVPQGSGIYVRENGQNREITRAEWDEKFPGTEPVVVKFSDEYTNCVYDANITHNLNKMADEAGIYEALWRPDEIGITTAKQLIEPLRVGLELLKSNPNRFKAFNPRNGWGDYDGFVDWVARYLHACEEYPDARVSVSR